MAKTRPKRRKPCVHPTIASQKKARTCRVSFDIGHVPGKQGRREETCWMGSTARAHRTRRIETGGSPGTFRGQVGAPLVLGARARPPVRCIHQGATFPGGRTPHLLPGHAIQHDMPRPFAMCFNAPRYDSTHDPVIQRAATVAPAAFAVGTAAGAPSAGVLGKSPQPPPSARIRLTVDTACAPAN